ncbi:TIGR02466 family protein [Stella sp.]|uniref:TIGR02466 family protein n=1 Tax=Stella sp. TaxID=2912054 RepID=UPI0035B0C6E8
MTIDIALDRDCSLFFGTPIVTLRPDGAAAVNAGLRRVILERAAREPGVARSNAGGWQSRPDLLTWGGPEVETYRRWLEQAVRTVQRLPARRAGAEEFRLSFTAQAWANVSHAGHYNETHTHPGNHWAVVYYVSAPPADPARPMAGRLELRDPRPAAALAAAPGFAFGAALTLAAEAGLMVLFPAWLEHAVHPFFAAGERISIAANVAITDYAVGPAPATRSSPA